MDDIQEEDIIEEENDEILEDTTSMEEKIDLLSFCDKEQLINEY